MSLKFLKLEKYDTITNTPDVMTSDTTQDAQIKNFAISKCRLFDLGGETMIL